MAIIVELTLSGGGFELAEVLATIPETQVELERLVPTGDRAVPLVWVFDSHREEFEEQVSNHPLVASLRTSETFEDRTLYRIDWVDPPDSLFQAIEETDAVLLRMEGIADRWHLELRFQTSKDVQAFQRHLAEGEFTYDVTSVSLPASPADRHSGGLSDAQREAITLALERGYFDVPRTCSLADLAEQLGISDQAVSERIRRGTVVLASNALGPSNTD